MYTVRFWKKLAERAIKSGAQALVGLWAADQFNVLEASWSLAGGVFLGGMLLSAATSLASLKVGEPGTPDTVR